MATEIVNVIDPNMGSGYDYDSLVDWEAGEQGDLTGVRDEIAVAKCRCTGGTADTGGAVIIDGWTTSATQYIKIWTDPSETYRHSGVYPSSGNIYRLTPSQDVAVTLQCDEDYVKIIGIALSISSHASRTDYLSGFTFNSGGGLEISSCIVKGKANISASYGINFRSNSIGPVKVSNCIVFDFTGSNNDNLGIRVDNSTTNQTGFIYSNTVVNCSTGMLTERWAQHSIRNNLIRSCVVSFSGQWLNAYNNATDLSSSGISADNSGNNRVSQSFTFVDEANDNFHLAAGDTGALGYGLNLYNDANYPFQNDIDGDDRGGNGATWDIGADQYVASGAALPRHALDGPFYGSLRGSVR